VTPDSDRIDIRRIARTISAVENRSAAAEQVVRDAYRNARYVPVVGVTGPPGAGKSTLVDLLAFQWAERGEKVAVLAVDPSSPFTGGAVLGDRFRMEHGASHPRVFVRSLASRGQMGGLGSTTTDIAMVLGHLGFDRVVLETVGAGQCDISVGMVADVVMVVSVPGLGDQIQASKAGILEIADVYAVNKSDLPGAASVTGHLKANLDLIYPGSPGRNPARPAHAMVQSNPEQLKRHGAAADPLGFWRPPVLGASAKQGAGIVELVDAAEDFLAWSRETGRYAHRLAERLRFQVLRATQDRLIERCLAGAREGGVDLGSLVAAIASGEATPQDAASRLIASGMAGRAGSAA